MTRRLIHVTPGRLTARVTIGTLAVAVAACALLAGSAYANTNRVELVNAATNLRADVMWASGQDGQNAFLWPNNTSASQEFDLINMGGGFFQIRARHSGKCLMLDKTQPTVGNGTRIAQYPCKTDASYKSAQWSFEDMNGNCEANALCIDAGRRIIRNRYTGKCIDTANPSGKRPGQQAVLQLWTCISSPSCMERRQPDLEDLRPRKQAANHPALVKATASYVEDSAQTVADRRSRPVGGNPAKARHVRAFRFFGDDVKSPTPREALPGPREVLTTQQRGIGVARGRLCPGNDLLAR